MAEVKDYGMSLRGQLSSLKEMKKNDSLWEAKEKTEKTYIVKTQSELNKWDAVLSTETIFNGDAEEIGRREYDYNNKLQKEKETTYSYDYRTGQTIDTSQSQETNYMWESQNAFVEINNLSAIESTSQIVLEEGMEKIKVEVQKKYDENNLYLSTEIEDPISKEVIEMERIEDRDEETHLPIKVSKEVLMDGTTPKGYQNKVLYASFRDPFEVNNDIKKELVIAEFSSAREEIENFYYLPLGDYEEEHFKKFVKEKEADEGDVWALSGEYVRGPSITGESKLGSNIISCLSNTSIQFLKSDELSVGTEYLFCGWVSPVAEGDVTLTIEGEVTIITSDNETSHKEGWIYFEKRIELGDSVILDAESGARLDRMWVVPIVGEYTFNMYSNNLKELRAIVGKNGVVQKEEYDYIGEAYRSYMELPEGRVIENGFNLYGYSRFNGYASEVPALQEVLCNTISKDMNEVPYDPKNPNVMTEMITQGDTIYNVKNGFELKDSFLLRAKNLQIGGDRYGINLRSNIGIIYSIVCESERKIGEYSNKCIYQLIEGADNVVAETEVERLVNNWDILVLPGIILFYGDGKLLLQAKGVDFGEATKGWITESENTFWSDTTIYYNPVVKTTYIDSVGNSIQSQTLNINDIDGTLSDVIVNEVIYDASQNPILETKKAMYNTDEFPILESYKFKFLEDERIMASNDLYLDIDLNKVVLTSSGSEFQKEQLDEDTYRLKLKSNGDYVKLEDGELILTSIQDDGALFLKSVNSFLKIDSVDGNRYTYADGSELEISEDYTARIFKYKDKFVENIDSDGQLTGEVVDLLREEYGDIPDINYPYIHSEVLPFIERNEKSTMFPGEKYKSDGSKISYLYNEESEGIDDILDDLGIMKPQIGEMISSPFDLNSKKVEENTLVSEDGKVIGESISCNGDIISWHNEYKWTPENERVMENFFPKNGLKNTMTSVDPLGRVVKLEEPDTEGATYIFKDNLGRARFINTGTNPETNIRAWKYQKYDDLGRVVEIGMLDDVMFAGVEDNVPEILVQANDVSYPSAADGEYRTRYYYDADEHREGYDHFEAADISLSTSSGQYLVDDKIHRESVAVGTSDTSNVTWIKEDAGEGKFRLEVGDIEGGYLKLEEDGNGVTKTGYLYTNGTQEEALVFETEEEKYITELEGVKHYLVLPMEEDDIAAEGLLILTSEIELTTNMEIDESEYASNGHLKIKDKYIGVDSSNEKDMIHFGVGTAQLNWKLVEVESNKYIIRSSGSGNTNNGRYVSLLEGSDILLVETEIRDEATKFKMESLFVGEEKKFVLKVIDIEHESLNNKYLIERDGILVAGGEDAESAVKMTSNVDIETLSEIQEMNNLHGRLAIVEHREDIGSGNSVRNIFRYDSMGRIKIVGGGEVNEG